MENEVENTEINIILRMVEECKFSASVVALIKLCDSKRILYEAEKYNYWKTQVSSNFLKVNPPTTCNKQEFYECFSQMFEILGDFYAMVNFSSFEVY